MRSLLQTSKPQKGDRASRSSSFGSGDLPPPNPPRHLAALLLTLLLLVVFAACQPGTQPKREIFDEAESAYREGHYDLALERYETFLKVAPDHQLAPLAQERVLSIERELEVVMGRKQGSRPIYLRPVPPQQSPEGP